MKALLSTNTILIWLDMAYWLVCLQCRRVDTHKFWTRVDKQCKGQLWTCTNEGRHEVDDQASLSEGIH